jgi:hypothetical protein
MLRPIDASTVARLALQLSGCKAFIHVEVTPGGFVRNLPVDLEDVVLRGAGPTYRLALRCASNGWVVLEGLTHMAIDGEILMLCTLEEDRLTRVIQLSKEAFAA